MKIRLSIFCIIAILFLLIATGCSTFGLNTKLHTIQPSKNYANASLVIPKEEHYDMNNFVQINGYIETIDGENINDAKSKVILDPGEHIFGVRWNTTLNNVTNWSIGEKLIERIDSSKVGNERVFYRTYDSRGLYRIKLFTKAGYSYSVNVYQELPISNGTINAPEKVCLMVYESNTTRKMDGISSIPSVYESKECATLDFEKESWFDF